MSRYGVPSEVIICPQRHIPQHLGQRREEEDRRVIGSLAYRYIQWIDVQLFIVMQICPHVHECSRIIVASVFVAIEQKGTEPAGVDVICQC